MGGGDAEKRCKTRGLLAESLINPLVRPLLGIYMSCKLISCYRICLMATLRTDQQETRQIKRDHHFPLPIFSRGLVGKSRVGILFDFERVLLVKMKKK